MPPHTRLLGPLNGNAVEIKQGAALAILGRSAVERQSTFAQGPGWPHLDVVQPMGDDYACDLGAVAHGDDASAFSSRL